MPWKKLKGYCSHVRRGFRRIWRRMTVSKGREFDAMLRQGGRFFGKENELRIRAEIQKKPDLHRKLLQLFEPSELKEMVFQSTQRGEEIGLGTIDSALSIILEVFPGYSENKKRFRREIYGKTSAIIAYVGARIPREIILNGFKNGKTGPALRMYIAEEMRKLKKK